jgi:hypothetical protein
VRLPRQTICWTYASNLLHVQPIRKLSRSCACVNNEHLHDAGLRKRANRLSSVVFQAGLKAGLCSAPASSPARLAAQSRHCSRIAWPLGRCHPPTLLAIGQNRHKTGNTCLLTPSARSGRMRPQ